MGRDDTCAPSHGSNHDRCLRHACAWSPSGQTGHASSQERREVGRLISAKSNTGMTLRLVSDGGPCSAARSATPVWIGVPGRAESDARTARSTCTSRTARLSTWMRARAPNKGLPGSGGHGRKFGPVPAPQAWWRPTHSGTRAAAAPTAEINRDDRYPRSCRGAPFRHRRAESASRWPRLPRVSGGGHPCHIWSRCTAQVSGPVAPSIPGSRESGPGCTRRTAQIPLRPRRSCSSSRNFIRLLIA